MKSLQKQRRDQIDIPCLRQARLLCIGDVILDRFVSGDVERVSREAPIPVLRITDQKAMLGGAGNVARNLAALGVKTEFVCVTGDDEISHEIVDLLVKEDNLTPHIFTRKGSLGTLKTRYLCKKQQMLRVDRVSRSPLRGAMGQRVLKRVSELMSECGALIISDYGDGTLSPQILVKMIAIGRQKNIPIIVDPYGADYSIYAGADIIKPNHDELALASGLPVEDTEMTIAAAQRLIEEFQFGAVLATRGDQGMILVQGNERPPVALPARARDVFDVSGAGDTVAAVFSAGLACGLEREVAAQWANMAAGLVVAKSGTAVLTLSELRTEWSRFENVTHQSKIFYLDDLLDRVTQWRAQKLRIGFTNGCFDLLHPGHISLLKQARAACDCLIVGLNSDPSVSRLKGARRPIQNAMARATVLAALGIVDAVVVFGEDTPMTLIEAIRPDLLVKGQDYTLDQVVGAEIVRSYGGEILLAELHPGYSTTRTLSRVTSEKTEPDFQVVDGAILDDQDDK